MVFTETSRLHDHSTLNGQFQLFLSRRPWKWLIIPGLLLIPMILWVGVTQYHDPVPTPIQMSTALQTSPISKSVSNRMPNSNSGSEPTSIPGIKIPSESNKPVATYELVITSGNLAPDNFLQESYLINGIFPGPTIRVKHNSTLIVHVTNNLTTNAITIHFHGIHQRGSFLNDGVPNVTQKPIMPGESFTYTVDTWPQTGTFFYHAHTGMDIVSLYGALVIEDDPAVYKNWPVAYQYDEEKVFTLNGVYHESLDKIVMDIIGPVHNYPRIINSVTFNGKSYGVWDTENQTQSPSKPQSKTSAGYEVVSVKQGLRYRFRFINAASDSILICNISDHTFTVIEMDGIYTEPVETDELLISPGQRYSILIEMNQDLGNYQILCRHTDTSGPKNGVAILNYKGGSYPTKQLRQEDMGSEMERLPLTRWVLDQLTPNYDLKQTDVYAIPPTVDKEFMIDVEEVPDGERQHYIINGHRYEEPTIPYYAQLQQNISLNLPPQVFEIKKGDVVQFIFQNRVGRSCFSHPWHIHGHSYYIVGEGPDDYDAARDAEQIKENTKAGNENRFRFRDTVTLFANQTVVSYVNGAPCGWTAVRFIANNPGLWLSHCHVTPHMLMGKKFVIWEHSDEDPFLSELMK